MRLIVFGAGDFGIKFIKEYAGKNEIVAIVDNYCNDCFKMGHKILKPNAILDLEYDKLVICLADETVKDVARVKAVYEQLFNLGIPIEKIMLQNFKSYEVDNFRPRTKFAEVVASELKNVNGAVAECGVLRGNFAGILNLHFNDRKLYLFDTFEGFDEQDIEAEKNAEAQEWLFEFGAKEIYANGSEILALLRCPYKENVEIRKGYVPNTFEGLENVKFCFVNLDMDLYQPTINALDFFYDKLEANGMILLHDYFQPKLPGIKQAVDEFVSSKPKSSFRTFPIGDGISIGLIKVK